MISSKISSTLIICLALIGSVVVYDKKNELFGKIPASQKETIVDPVVNTAQNTLSNTTDWKKSLATISTSNEPIKIVTGKDDVNNENETLTSQMSKTFFSLYLDRQKNGVIIDENESIAIADQTLSQLKIPTNTKEYTVTDLSVLKDSSVESMRLWATNTASIIKRQFPSSRKSEMLLLYKALQTKKESDIAMLDPAIKSYKNAIHDIIALPIPEKLVPYALVYINTLNRLLFDLVGMRKILTDPAMGYIYFSSYQRDSTKLELIVQKMNEDFSK